MFSIYDEQLSRYLCSGRNSKTLREAVEDCWEYWIGGCDMDEEDIKTMENWSWKRKQRWLEGTEFRFDDHNEKIDDDED